MQRPAYGFEGAEDEETDCRDDDDASDNASFEKQFEEVVMGVVHISPEDVRLLLVGGIDVDESAIAHAEREIVEKSLPAR